MAQKARAHRTPLRTLSSDRLHPDFRGGNPPQRPRANSVPGIRNLLLRSRTSLCIAFRPKQQHPHQPTETPGRHPPLARARCMQRPGHESFEFVVVSWRPCVQVLSAARAHIVLKRTLKRTPVKSARNTPPPGQLGSSNTRTHATHAPRLPYPIAREKRFLHDSYDSGTMQ